MSIEWNKVTWYSRVLAVVLFLLVLLFGAIIGAQYQSLIDFKDSTTKQNTSIQKNKQENENISSSNFSLVQERYVSTKLGVAFNYAQGISNKAVEFGNKILHPDYGFDMYIEVIDDKTLDETIERAILDHLTIGTNVDTSKCKIVKGDMNLQSGFDSYFIDLAHPLISYTAEEEKEIREADISAKKDQGPFDGTWKKQEIYNRHLVQECTSYAEPLGLGTSTTLVSKYSTGSQKYGTHHQKIKISVGDGVFQKQCNSFSFAFYAIFF